MKLKTRAIRPPLQVWLGHDIGRRRQEDDGIFSEGRHKKVSHLSGRVRPDWGPGSQEDGWGLKPSAHRLGYRNFPVPDVTANCWWVARVAYGRGLAQPSPRLSYLTSPWDEVLGIGPAHTLICLLQAVGLAWDRQVPPAHKLQFRPH